MHVSQHLSMLGSDILDVIMHLGAPFIGVHLACLEVLPACAGLLFPVLPADVHIAVHSVAYCPCRH